MKASALLLALLSGSAFSYSGVNASYSNGVASVNARVITSEVITSAAGSAKAVGKVDLIGPGGRAVLGDMTTTIGGRAALNIAARVLPLVGAGAIIYDIYRNQMRAKPDASGEGFVMDQGTASVPVTRTCTTQTSISAQTIGTGGQSSTGPWCGSDALSATVAYCAAVVLSGRPDCTVLPANTWISGATRIRYRNSNSSGNDFFVEGYVGLTTGLQQICPAYTDYDGTARAAGYAKPSSIDGKCPDGVYDTPVTAAFLADRALASSVANSLDYGAMMREAAGLGPITLPTEVAQGADTVKFELAPKLGAVDGGTVTTTKPDGTVVEESLAYDLTPGIADKTATATFKEKKTTKTTSPSGTVTTENTTRTSPMGPDGKPVETVDTADPCVKDPGRLGCVGLGEVPDVDLGKSTKTVTVAPASGWGASNASCPAARTFTVLGKTVSMDYTPACNFFATLRPFIVAFFGLAAALLLVSGVKE